MIRSRICDIERKIYTMESMIYMTAGNKINLIKIILFATQIVYKYNILSLF